MTTTTDILKELAEEIFEAIDADESINSRAMKKERKRIISAIKIALKHLAPANDAETQALATVLRRIGIYIKYEQMNADFIAEDKRIAK